MTLNLAALIFMAIVTIDLLALVSVIGAPRPARTKLLWGMLVLGVPLLGFLIWAAAGPRAASRPGR